MNKKTLAFLATFLTIFLFIGNIYTADAQQQPAQRKPQEQVSTSQNDTKLADYIIAIVQHEPITYAQLRAQVQLLKQGAQPGISDASLEQTALQQLIAYSALTQRAKEYGMHADPQMITQAISTIASNSNKTVSQLRQDFVNLGIPFSTLEKSVEQQILARQLRERTLDPTIYVNNAEVDAYLREASKVTNSSDLKISLAQILIAVPEGATKKQEEALLAKAQTAYKKAQQITSIQDFIDLVEQYSDDPNKAQTNGALGIMPASSYPDLFIEAVNGLNPGGVTPPIRSGAGYHILLVIDREQSEMIVQQTHARHILLNITDDQPAEKAIQILLDDKRKIESGQVGFDVLAQEQSQDNSAQNGGDLGWVVSGMFVPEFEAVMNQLKPGEISDPVVTRFGVHLIQVLERRDAELTPSQRREIAKEIVHQRKVNEAYDQWVQNITGQSYIEYRNVPR